MRRLVTGLLACALLGSACVAAPTATPVPPTATSIPSIAPSIPTAPSAPQLTPAAAATGTALPPAPTEASVSVVDNGFSPRTQRLKAGGVVTWKYTGESGHTITDTVGGTTPDTRGKVFDKVISSGESFSFAFAAAGNYPYICRFHSGMAGTVVVE